MKYFLWFIGLVILVIVAILVFTYTPRPNADQVSNIATEKVMIFFTKMTETDMEFVPVEREVRKSNEVELLVLEALEELVKGPTAAEEAQGLSASFNLGTKVNYVHISGGTLTVDFNYLFDTPMGGSARVGSLSGMIDRTVRQFPLEGIEEIKLTVNRGQRPANLEP